MCGHVRAFLRIRKWEFWIEINLTNHSLGEQKIIHFLSATKSSFFAILSSWKGIQHIKIKISMMTVRVLIFSYQSRRVSNDLINYGSTHGFDTNMA